ncbi:MAG: cell division protein CrgA [Actinomycetes bacterium]
MAKKQPKGRTTERPSKGAGRTKARTTQPSGRYTPPTPKTVKRSPLWLPVLMFALLGCGLAVIVGNYLGLLPGEQQNRYLLIGLVEIAAGFIVATQYH